ncbi:MAG: response regulator [Pseudomonadota bacterium]|nr:response regulator [Pseudomonadota bacterium]
MPTRTVLVVDASPLSARRVQEALRGTGFTVVVAANNADAEVAVEAGGISVALAALSFPGGNGYDLARVVKTRSPEAVVFLLCGGFEVFNGERADQVGVYGRINRPFAVDTLVRHLEAALGPLAPGGGTDTPAPSSEFDPVLPIRRPPVVVNNPAPVEPADTIQAYDGPMAPAPAPAAALDDGASPRTSVGDERLASFLPREWRSHPPVRVDPDVVGPALERAILEVLPEVVEVILNKALSRSPALRDLIEVAVDEAVRAQIGPIARRVIRERLAEIEAGGEDAG